MPGSSIVVPGLEYAWQPPASEAFGFDLAKAGQMLTAAGYPLKNGVRLNKQGKPIVLRLKARNEETESQVAGKLITSWFDKLGLKIKFAVVDEGVLQTEIYNMKGKTYAPDWDMFLWGWGEYVDPNYILGVFTKAQIDGWNDCYWTNPAYDKLYAEQAQQMDPVKRAAEVQQMQKIFYDAAPYVVLAYQQDLQAYQSGAWQGWVRYPSNGGMVVFSNDNIDSYRFAEPKPAAAASGSSTRPCRRGDRRGARRRARRRVARAPTAQGTGRRALGGRPGGGEAGADERLPTRRRPHLRVPLGTAPSLLEKLRAVSGGDACRVRAGCCSARCASSGGSPTC